MDTSTFNLERERWCQHLQTLRKSVSSESLPASTLVSSLGPVTLFLTKQLAVAALENWGLDIAGRLRMDRWIPFKLIKQWISS
jgi:hypothetical protein